MTAPFCLGKMDEPKKFNYGGQAVIEGVMMRGQKAVVTAIRRPGGGLAMDIKPLPSVYTSHECYRRI